MTNIKEKCSLLEVDVIFKLFWDNVCWRSIEFDVSSIESHWNFYGKRICSL